MIALERLAAMHRLNRDPAAATRCERRARDLRKRLGAFVSRQGLLRDGLDAKGKVLSSTSPHAQTLALMSDLAPAGAAAQERFLLDYLRDESGHTVKPSAYWITYVYTVLATRGHGAEVVAHLRPRWEPMVAYGSTFELFRDHPEFQISHSHAWSAHPLFHLMQIIGGVRQAAPQWKRVEFSPVFVGETGGCTVPTPAGPITSAWRRKNAEVEVELALPRGVSATATLPGLLVQRVTGKHHWRVTLAQ